jgi:hypothetical protein
MWVWGEEGQAAQLTLSRYNYRWDVVPVSMAGQLALPSPAAAAVGGAAIGGHRRVSGVCWVAHFHENGIGLLVSAGKRPR